MGEDTTQKILIVDDSPMNRMILIEMLGEDYSIIEAEDGLSAIEKLQENSKIDLILLDIMMPKMDGFETLERLNQLHLIDHIPVIMISAENSPEIIEKAYTLGAIDYITRPFDVRVVRLRVNATLALFENQKQLLTRLQAKDRLEKRKIPVKGLMVEDEFYENADQRLRHYFEDNSIASPVLIAMHNDYFKLLSEWSGASVSDQYLETVGNCLLKVKETKNALVGYFGLDNFVVMMEEDWDSIHGLIRDIKESLEAIRIELGFTPAYGIYRAIREDVDLAPVAMYDRALLALEKSMNNYMTRYAVYDPRESVNIEQDIKMLNRLEYAFKNKEFHFYIQPKCDMISGKIIGGEALVRWNSKNDGLIYPGVFIPVLEKNGFITRIDTYVWEEVCKWQRRWMDKGRISLPVSVNVSLTDVYAINVPEYFKELIEKHNIPANLVDIEISESAYVKGGNLIRETINRLKEYGFRVFLDNFGSGYSSLNLLRDINVDVIKIDARSLDLKAGNSEDRRGIGILETMVNLAKQMSLPVVVQGVEEAEQVRYLTQMGCRYAQGFYFFRSMVVDEYEEKIKVEEDIDTKREQVVEKDSYRIQEFFTDHIYNDLMLNHLFGSVVEMELYQDELKILKASDTYYLMVGCNDRNDPYYRVSRKHIHPADWQPILQSFKKAFEQRYNGSVIDFRFIKKDGDIINFHAKIFASYAKDARKYFYACVENVNHYYTINSGAAVFDGGGNFDYFRGLN